MNFGGSNELAVVLAEGMGYPSSGGDSDPQRRHRGPADCPRESKPRRDFVVDAVHSEAQKLGLNVLAHLGDMQAAFPMTVVAVNAPSCRRNRAW